MSGQPTYWVLNFLKNVTKFGFTIIANRKSLLSTTPTYLTVTFQDLWQVITFFFFFCLSWKILIQVLQSAWEWQDSTFTDFFFFAEIIQGKLRKDKGKEHELLRDPQISTWHNSEEIQQWCKPSCDWSLLLKKRPIISQINKWNAFFFSG